MQQYHPFLKKKQVDYNVPIDDNMQFHLSIYIDYILQVSQDSITFPAWINTKSNVFVFHFCIIYPGKCELHTMSL